MTKLTTKMAVAALTVLGGANLGGCVSTDYVDQQIAALKLPQAAPGAEGGHAFGPAVMSQAAARVTQWIVASGDNGDLPFVVIDKEGATVFVYDAKGELLGETPALVGIASGDDSTPGVAGKTLAELGPAEKTTPAGRFMATIGPALDEQNVLWLDYTTAVALHAVATDNRKERRRERLLSPSVDDNRITFGCINVPTHFFHQRVYPVFEKTGGVVYVLPDTKPLEVVFPQVRGKQRARSRAST